ncbi:MAG TPA: prepilin-type N-terminal cleavage/methylation domain-containing protein [Candidatus Paceibacterota bacterium]
MKKHSNRSSLQAFTLIELLVVIGLIGVFIGIITVMVSRSRTVGDDTNKASLVRSITGNVESYKAKYGKYPASLNDSNLVQFQNFSTDQKAQVTYIAFDLDGNTSTCEAYSVSTMLGSPDGRELQHDDDRIIQFSGSANTCMTVVNATMSASCTQGSAGCMFGKPFIKTGDSSGQAQDWVFDLSNVPFN